HIGFMSPYVWMFISSHEKLRNKIITASTISSLIQLEYSGFEGATVPICTFTLRNNNKDILGEYIRLSDFVGAKQQPIKTKEAVANPGVTYRYTFNQKAFKEIPGSAIAYWISDNLIKVFTKSDPLMNYANCATGMQTGNNNKYMRLWFEINYNQFNSKPEKTTHKWQKYNAGGNSRKWYGNHTYVIYWENDGHDVKADKKSVIRNENFYFKEGISWKRIGSSDFFLRYLPSGFIIDQSGDTMYMKDDKWLNYILGYVNTKVA